MKVWESNPRLGAPIGVQPPSCRSGYLGQSPPGLSVPGHRAALAGDTSLFRDAVNLDADGLPAVTILPSNPAEQLAGAEGVFSLGLGVSPNLRSERPSQPGVVTLPKIGPIIEASIERATFSGTAEILRH